VTLNLHKTCRIWIFHWHLAQRCNLCTWMASCFCKVCLQHSKLCKSIYKKHCRITHVFKHDESEKDKNS